MLGDMIAQEFLLGSFRMEFETVVCSVKDVVHSGNLRSIGAKLVRVGSEPLVDRLSEELRHCDTLVLIPNCFDESMISQADLIIKAATSAGSIHTLVLVSLLGADEDTATSRKFKTLEEMVFKADRIASSCVVRHGFLQQNLFWCMDQIRTEHKVKLPWSTADAAKCAPLNLYDLAVFVAHVCRGYDVDEHADKIYRLTGPELLSGKITSFDDD